MNLFKKKDTEIEIENEKAQPSPKKRINKAALRHGGYATAVIAVAIAAVIIINGVMSVISDRGYLKFDLTTTAENSISEENLEFIKNVSVPVKITVLATEDSYTGGYLNNFTQTYKNVVDDSNYYTQTVTLLKKYAEYNRNITVEFVDFYGTQSAAIAEEYPSLFYGDIYIEYTDAASGNTRSRLVTYDDIYTYSDDTGYAAYGYASYYVDSNNIETAVTSAIHTLTSGEVKKLGVITSHSSGQGYKSLYENSLKLNGFKITEISDAVITSISEEIDTLLISEPSSDFLPDELTAINNWLKNGGSYGKSVLFFPSTSMAGLDNLKEFMAEWGIKYSEGLLYQTDESYCSPDDPATMVIFGSESDISNNIVPATGSYSITGYNMPMETAFDNYASRTPYVVVSTNDTVTVAPSNMSDNWKPASNAELKSYANLIVTKESEYVDNVEKSSYVAAFSSIEFIYSDWAQQSSLQNMDFAVNTALYTSGMESDITFVPKTITTESFAGSVTAAGTTAINIIFVALLPIGIIASGIIVWVRRKRQ